ncbi:MAG TPA: hypothetical protein VN881_08560 [Candidatus Acidoferrales bacterium]|jgi:hypothetical protein|nr:hypothetical protein [Candidatus Acidoferrales bacterium]
MTKAIGMFAVVVLVSGIFAAQVGSQAKPAGGFDRLKTLVGEWSATPEGGKAFTSTIRFVSNNTALEEAFEGDGHSQMVTVYVADGDRVALTHFCSMGNQPRMETPGVTHDSNEFAFAFTGATNLASADDMHMHQMTLKIDDNDHFSETWTMHANGKEQTETFHFTRKKA